MNTTQYVGGLFVLALLAAAPVIPEVAQGLGAVAIAGYLWKLSATLSAMKRDIHLQGQQINKIADRFERHLEYHISKGNGKCRTKKKHD